MKRHEIVINGKAQIVMSGRVTVRPQGPFSSCIIHLPSHSIGFFFNPTKTPFSVCDIVTMDRGKGCVLKDGRRIKWIGKPGVHEAATDKAILNHLQLQREESVSTPMAKMLTIQEAAVYAGVTDRTIRSWRNDGLLSGIIGKGRLTRIPTTSLDLFKSDKNTPPIEQKKKPSSRKR